MELKPYDVLQIKRKNGLRAGVWEDYLTLRDESDFAQAIRAVSVGIRGVDGEFRVYRPMGDKVVFSPGDVL